MHTLTVSSCMHCGLYSKDASTVASQSTVAECAILGIRKNSVDIHHKMEK